MLAVGSVLHLVQSLGRRGAVPLVLVTRGAQSVHGERADARAAGPWGLAGVIAAEHPELGVRIVDLDAADTPAHAADRLLEHLGDATSPARPASLALRGRDAWVPRFAHRPRGRGARHGDSPDAATSDALHAEPLRARVERPGLLDGTVVEPSPRRPLGPDDVRIAVIAAGLNFRDVMLTLGLYVGEPVPLGAECCGTVVEAGRDTTLRVGETVFGYAPGALGTEVVVPAAFVAPVPRGLAPLDAATLPVGFFTAIHGLHAIAGLSAGDRVLIHAAAGGVGLAAVQWASRVGAEIFATAGSPEKRRLLESLGVRHVLDSRSLDFAHAIRSLTDGRGVDVVLNSLAGDFVDASFGLLAPGGRFLELGKRDLDRLEALARQRPDVRCAAYDLGRLVEADPTLLPPLFTLLAEGLSDGTLRPLPRSDWPLHELPAALRHMAQARHVGKLAITMPRRPPRVRAGVTYWITGGLGALGLHTARWLASHGATHLVLSSRRPPDESTSRSIDALRARGIGVRVVQADAGDREAMQAIADRIAESPAPLAGVFHAAGALRDAVLASQRWSDAAEVLRGKAHGAFVLDEVTASASLEWFVLYAAGNRLLGAGGQGLYSAANAQLEALAADRRARGLRGLAVQWGAWDGDGMAGRLSAAFATGGDPLEQRGLGRMPPAQAFAALERLAQDEVAVAAVLTIDWARFARKLPAGADRAFFGALLQVEPPARVGSEQTASASASAAATTRGLDQLRALPAGARRGALLQSIEDRARHVLDLDATIPIEPTAVLKELGLDSLMAVELRNALARVVGRALPATLLFDHPTPAALADHLMKRLGLLDGAAEPATGPNAATRPDSAASTQRPDAVAGLSDEEAEAALLLELSEMTAKSPPHPSTASGGSHAPSSISGGKPDRARLRARHYTPKGQAMSDQSSTHEEVMTPVKRALLEIRELRAKLHAAEAWVAARHEPIAIVGMGMRLPGGVVDAEGYAELLWSARDAVGPVPPSRWDTAALYAADPDAPGRLTTRHGAFIDDVEQFDADFFGISPREADTMDPQQRLLLQVSWEALEDAGHAPDRLAGSRTGVYLGIAAGDYGRALFAHRDRIDAWTATGTASSVAAGRLSYLLGLQGPSLAVDTACSSSLVALHLACQALRRGECDRALAGGVNLVLTPELSINFSKARMMAADGRCKTFDAAADGYVRGEGCGVVVLRRLSDAEAAGDRILAIVRGTAINQDGRSSGLTAPNGPQQEAVIHEALRDAGVRPAQIGYVETHGTGTSLGDPIEVTALAAALAGHGERAQPVVLGSVKTNIGHLEAAAGMAGLIKVVLAGQRGEIPPNLHFHQGNPHIDWASSPVTVPTRTVPWPAIDGLRIAGVSSFGFSGTNAHVVVEAVTAGHGLAMTTTPAPEPEGVPSEAGRATATHVLAVSARTGPALRELAMRHARHLAAAGAVQPVAAVCRTAGAGRAHFGHRLAVSGRTVAELRAGLLDWLALRDSEAAQAADSTARIAPRVAFLFTGQGSQYAGMGRALYERWPAFADALEECAALLSPLLEQDLLAAMFEGTRGAPLDRPSIAQPALFAFQHALSALWRSFGVEPAVVMGHSLGEYAAACAAGVLSLEDACRLVAERGRLTEMLGAGGAMAAVHAPARVAEEAVAVSNGALSIAAFNGPEHVVLSGTEAALDAALEQLQSEGVRCKRLHVAMAAHSALVAPMLAPFAHALEGVSFHPPRIALVSNVTGRPVAGDEMAGIDYWSRHLREPVRFQASMEAVASMGITHFIEIGPHPVLLGMGAECVDAGAFEWLPSDRRDDEGAAELVRSLRQLYVDGASIDWAGVHAGSDAATVALPTYPFQTRRYWTDLAPPAAVSVAMPATSRWQALEQALAERSDVGPLDLNALSYPAKWALLAKLTTAHAAQVLRDAGLFGAAGETRTLDDVLQVARIGEAYRHLVQRWLDRLAAAGALERVGDAWCAPRPLGDPGLDALWSETTVALDDNQPLLAYLRQCGRLAGSVLQGRESPLETLFPGGSFELAQGLYERSATMRYINGLAGAALEAVARALPAGDLLRVIEIGAGTGGTTSSLLPRLDADRTQYVYTDVSELFLDRGRARFGDRRFIDYRLLNLDEDLAPQGHEPGSFDVVVSANCVHAVTDLRKALERLHELLAPGGVVVLVESTVHLDWFDMSTGLIEGWQHFADDLRGDNPLLPPETWIGALRDAGFDAAGAWPPASSPASHLGQHVVVARKAGTAQAARTLSRSDTADNASAAGESALLRPAAEAPGQALRDGLRHELQEAIHDALPDERVTMVRDFVRGEVMRVLRRGADHPPALHDRLMDLGFDSLMAVQLRNRLATGLGLGGERPLPATLMFDHPTIEAIGTYLLERLAPAPARADDRETAPSARGSAVAPSLGLDAVAAMSDADVEALLLARLGDA